MRNLILLLLSALSASAQITANFTAGPTNGAAPLTVIFTNTSIGATVYSWDFGNGSISTNVNATNVYVNPGFYSVTLFATNDVTGDSNSITRSSLINVRPNFAVQVIGSNTNGEPAFWPSKYENIGGAITAPSPWTWATEATLLNVIATNQAAHNVAQSNRAVAISALNAANLNAVVVAYSNLQFVADNFALVTNVANIRISLQATGDLLLKLKPVLTLMYLQSQGQ